jgi:anti-anti-sigma factor
MRPDVTRNDEDPDYARPKVLTVTSRRDGERVIIALVGELDMEGVDALVAEVRDHLARRPLTVEIDGLGLAFVDSVGLRSLLGLQAEVSAAGCTFGVAASPSLTRLLELTGLVGVLTVVA